MDWEKGMKWEEEGDRDGEEWCLLGISKHPLEFLRLVFAVSEFSVQCGATKYILSHLPLPGCLMLECVLVQVQLDLKTINTNEWQLMF